jgi:hypothetical protein
MAVHGQVARLSALALATGTLVAVGTAPAAAAAQPEVRLSADGTGSALTLTINLPAALAGTPLGQTIRQQISLTDGSVSTVSGPLAETTAILGKGTTPVLSDLLNRSTVAILTGEREQSSAGLNVDQNGIKLQVLPLVSKVADPMQDGVLASSSSGIARVAIGGLALPVANVTVPVAEVLDTALATVDETGQAAVGTVGSTLTGAIDTLNSATDNSAQPVTAPVREAIDATVADLTETLTDLTGAVDLLTAGSNLVTLDSVTSDQAISRKGSQVTSTVSNVVKNVDLLNGLVKIAAVESTATAVAGGKPGTGAATTKAPVLDVALANGALTAILDENGLNVGGTVGDNLPAELEGTVNQAVNTLNETLAATLGLDVQIGKGATSVSPDGTNAAAAVSATTVTLNPPVIKDLLAAGQDFIKLELVTANAAVGSQLITPTVTPAALPRTGGALPLTGAIATGLIGLAMVARRRRAIA